jgi:hypothetical protein
LFCIGSMPNMQTRLIENSFNPFLEPYEIHRLPLGDIFHYILSVEWGDSSGLPIKDEALLNDCNNVHYEKPKSAEMKAKNEYTPS